MASDNIVGEGIRSLIEYHTQAQRTPSAAFMSRRKSAVNVISGVAANPHPDVSEITQSEVGKLTGMCFPDFPVYIIQHADDMCN